MNIPLVLLGIGLWLLTMPAQAQQGLKGEYYTGTNFNHKVFSRIDPKINFDWTAHNPGPGILHSYYSIRWTGKLLAPISGTYTFNAKVDDGIRVWVGNKKVMESWQLNDSESFRGSVVLEAGKYYDLRVDYFNDMMGGEIQLFWVLPNAPKLIFNGTSNPGEPITAQYFFQKAPPVVVPPKPNPIPVIKPVSNRPKPVIPKPTLPVTKNPIIQTELATHTVAKVVVSPPVRTTNPFDTHKSGETFVLPHVQFEQSSYTLLPESSAELDQLMAALKENPHWHIDVAGHTDNIGDPRLNLALSENRAKVVSTYLIRHGIADDRLTAKGYGGTRPIADNTIETERRKNRRVEITIR